MEKVLIGLVAPKQSGKDTVADYLCKNYGFEKYNFADPLKEGLSKIFGFTNEQLYGKDKEIVDSFWNVTPREVLQKVGTELFQYELPKIIEEFNDYGRGFWVKCFEKWYMEREKSYQRSKSIWSNSMFDNMIKGLPNDFIKEKIPTLKIVVSDVRFVHEVKKIRELGGILVKVERPTKENEYSLHTSELEFNKINCDFIIKNNKNIPVLYKEIDDLLKIFKKVHDI